MGSFSDYLENEILDHVFGGADYTRPATLYIALSTADPTDDGSAIAEPTVGSYARKSVTNNVTNWPAAASGAKANGTAITFVQSTAAWGTITHFAIFDALTGGNMLGHAALDNSQVVGSGVELEFSIGELDITLA